MDEGPAPAPVSLRRATPCFVRDHGVAAAPLSGVERTVGRICMRYEKVFDGPARLFGERGRAPDIEPGSKNANSSPP